MYVYIYIYTYVAINVQVTGNMTNETERGESYLLHVYTTQLSYWPRLDSLLSLSQNGTLPCDLPTEPHCLANKPDQNNYIHNCVVVCPKQLYACERS